MILRGWRGTAETFAVEKRQWPAVRAELCWSDRCTLRGMFPERLIDANSLDL